MPARGRGPFSRQRKSTLNLFRVGRASRGVLGGQPPLYKHASKPFQKASAATEKKRGGYGGYPPVEKKNYRHFKTKNHWKFKMTSMSTCPHVKCPHVHTSILEFFLNSRRIYFFARESRYGPGTLLPRAVPRTKKKHKT